MEKKQTKQTTKFCTYASLALLKVIGTFNCKIFVGHRAVDEEVCVISGRGESLLCRDTAMILGVLKMRVGVASVKSDLQDVGEIVERKYPELAN